MRHGRASLGLPAGEWWICLVLHVQLSSPRERSACVPAFDVTLTPGTYRVEVLGAGFDPAPRTLVVPDAAAPDERWLFVARPAGPER